MKKFKITSVYYGTECGLYSVIIDDSKHSEFDKFCERFSVLNKTDFDSIVDSMHKMAVQFGPREIFFKHESGKNIFRFLMPKEKRSNLRLYCIRFGAMVLIVGDGAVKRTQKWQDDLVLTKIIENLAVIDKFLSENEIDIEKACKAGTIFELGV